MPRRISRLGGTTFLRSFITNAYSPGICTWGPRDGPQTPYRSDRPGGAVAVLYLHGGPDMAPNPQSFGPPRRSRGGPLFKAYVRLLRAGGGALASCSDPAPRGSPRERAFPPRCRCGCRAE